MTNRSGKLFRDPANSRAAGGADNDSLIALLNEDLADSRALHDLSLHMLVEHDPFALYGRIIEAARQLMKSDFASLQMLSAGNDGDGQQKLELLAHCGFTFAAAEHWRVVWIDSATTCGVAWATGRRVIVSDVEGYAPFAGTADLATYRETGIRAVQTTPLRSRDGTLIGMLSTHWAHVHEPNERQLRLLDILTRQAADLIERARGEALLRESEARLKQMDRMKDQFLATLAHELRNPLAPIRNGLQILRLGHAQSGATRVFEMLDRQVGHMVRLVDDLMEVARINSGTIQLQCSRVDLKDVLDAALELSRSAVDKAGHALTVSMAPSSLMVNGDEVRLVQVFSNLINNAAKYTPEGGRIDISSMRQRDCAVIRVTDSGIGFAAEEQALLFTLFGRLQPESHGDGLGIGLALARKLVELHGGSISASSEGANKGSSFTVSLPVSQSADAPDSVERGREPGRLEGQHRGQLQGQHQGQLQGQLQGQHRVLVVDDNRDAADSLGELLRVIGCETAVFYDGAEALAAFEQFAPTIAFVDLGMPAMDGYELARRLNAIASAREARLVALTGWSQPDDRARSARSGFDHHLVKPISIAQLSHLLAQVASRETS